MSESPVDAPEVLPSHVMDSGNELQDEGAHRGPNNVIRLNGGDGHDALSATAPHARHSSCDLTGDTTPSLTMNANDGTPHAATESTITISTPRLASLEILPSANRLDIQVDSRSVDQPAPSPDPQPTKEVNDRASEVNALPSDRNPPSSSPEETITAPGLHNEPLDQSQDSRLAIQDQTCAQDSIPTDSDWPPVKIQSREERVRKIAARLCKAKAEAQRRQKQVSCRCGYRMELASAGGGVDAPQAIKDRNSAPRQAAMRALRFIRSESEHNTRAKYHALSEIEYIDECQFIGPICPSRVWPERHPEAYLYTLSNWNDHAEAYPTALGKITLGDYIMEGRIWSAFSAKTGDMALVAKFAEPLGGPLVREEAYLEAWIYHRLLKPLWGAVVPVFHGLHVGSPLDLRCRRIEMLCTVIEDVGTAMTKAQVDALSDADNPPLRETQALASKPGEPISTLRIIDFGSSSISPASREAVELGMVKKGRTLKDWCRLASDEMRKVHEALDLEFDDPHAVESEMRAYVVDKRDCPDDKTEERAGGTAPETRESRSDGGNGNEVDGVADQETEKVAQDDGMGGTDDAAKKTAGNDGDEASASEGRMGNNERRNGPIINVVLCRT